MTNPVSQMKGKNTFVVKLISAKNTLAGKKLILIYGLK